MTGAAKITHCVAWMNRAKTGSFLDAYTRYPEDYFPMGDIEVNNCGIRNDGIELSNNATLITIEYSNIMNNGNEGTFGVTWGAGNLEADPCFINPGYWDANGTPDDPNDDYFVEGDYHLKSQAGRWDPVSQT